MKSKPSRYSDEICQYVTGKLCLCIRQVQLIKFTDYVESLKIYGGFRVLKSRTFGKFSEIQSEDCNIKVERQEEVQKFYEVEQLKIVEAVYCKKIGAYIC